ncbi:tetratricopeptide repeat protein, partial [Amycolatopsis sp. SID8362]|nr:tetratricopeptide repeat protein [Amycolatopsis sp. SID8362]NED39150.1 tetratricopeptide repeat protein [Amycolatopsis sp. SID8362]
MTTPTAGEQEVWDRLWAAERLPRGRAQIAALEAGLREADALGSPELRFGARIFLTSAYQQGGEPAKAFVPFAWCLAVHDRGEADPRWTHDLHWYFKFMAGSMATFPEVPLERTRAVLDDMERRYRTAGYSMNPVHQYRAVLARHVGDREAAAEQYRLWSAAPRGQMSDCVGCEPSDKVAHLAWLGRYADAAEVAEPVLGGQFSCVEQPQHILTELLLPYVHIGRYDDAVQAHRRAYRAMRHDPAQLQSIATHVAFCALTGNHARGLDLVERHLGWLDAPPTPYAEQEFAAAAALTLRLVAEGGHGDAPVRRAG